MSKGTIKVQKELITIMTTENKREIVYSPNSRIPVLTKPFNINNE